MEGLKTFNQDQIILELKNVRMDPFFNKKELPDAAGLDLQLNIKSKSLKLTGTLSKIGTFSNSLKDKVQVMSEYEC